MAEGGACRRLAVHFGTGLARRARPVCSRAGPTLPEQPSPSVAKQLMLEFSLLGSTHKVGEEPTGARG